MQKTIRKVIIGKEVTLNAMNFTVGQSVINRTYNIHSIVREVDGDINIYIMDSDSYKKFKDTGKENGDILIWKEINKDIPCMLEFSQDFS